jgi:bacteriochlorophyllide a dehydrogenase
MVKGHAIVMTGVRQVEIQPVELSDPQPDEVLIRTEYSGVSQGTEIWALLGKRPELAFPTIPGYQSVGVVEAVGHDVTGVEVGERVHFNSARSPAHFPPTWMGAHTSHAIVSTISRSADSERTVVPVPDDVDPAAAAVSSLAAVSLRGLNMLRVGIGDLVVVNGQGMIGQGSAQLARLRGATVVAADINPTRLERSRACSADVVVDVREQSLADVVRALKPDGADVVIDTTGRSDQFAPCIDLLRWEGQFLLQGWYPDPITFDFHRTHQKKPTIAITCAYDNDEVAIALELLRYNKLRYRPLVTHLVPFGDAPRLYEMMVANDPTVMGVVFDWREAP